MSLLDVLGKGRYGVVRLGQNKVMMDCIPNG